jgi:periplasmic copper chaperone A
MIRHCALALFLALAAGLARADDLTISHAWVRLLPAGVPAAGYFTAHNAGSKPVRIVGASSPACGMVMLHQTVARNGQTSMEAIDGADVPAGGDLAFAPGGYHLMLMQPKPGLKPGGQIIVTLELSGGRKLAVPFQLKGPKGE